MKNKTMSTQKTRSDASRTLRLFVSASLRSRRDVVLAFLSPIGAVLTNIGVPYYATRALTSIGRSDSRFTHNMVGLAIVAVAGIIANRIGFVRTMDVQAKTMSYLHTLVFERLLQRGIGFHTNRIGGKLVSDALDFITAFSTLIMAVFNSGLSFVLVLITGLIIVTINSWVLGVFVFMTVASTLLLAYRESKTRSDLRTVRLLATKDLTSHLSDSIVNAQTVKTFAGEAQEIARNKRLNKKLLGLRLSDWRRAGISGNNRSAILVILMVILLLIVRYSAHGQADVVATGLFAFTYTFTLLLRLFDLNTLTRQIEESFLQAAPIMQILEESNEINDVPGARKLEVTTGAVSFNGVRFGYTDSTGEQTIFDDFNLIIPPGQKVGVIGPSGGGKTTLTRLLLRFEDIQDGSITIDGQDIAQITQTSLRQAIAYVPQEPLLFHRTIRENIAYARPSASDADVTRAARLAHADDFIRELAKQYDTVVGERGIKLSGGQRQRIAIARAILKDAPILVLDEATSALDSESEAAIQGALTQLMKGRTTLVIAHRLSTIQRMDVIVVLDHGTIVETGSHAELLAQGGLYARLWKHQSGGFIEE